MLKSIDYNENIALFINGVLMTSRCHVKLNDEHIYE